LINQISSGVTLHQNKKNPPFAVGFWERLAITNTFDELRRVEASLSLVSALCLFLARRFPCFSAYAYRFFYGGPLDHKQSAGVNNALPRAGKPNQFLPCVSSQSAIVKVFHKLSRISIVIELFGQIVISSIKQQETQG